MITDSHTLIYIRSGLKRLASPSVVFFILPWLMFLLVAGTIAQKDLGIYAAQNMFFSSWILWLGPIPLPGGYLTVGALTLCLLAKFLMYSPWSKNRAGTILTHLGMLILLMGGIITAFTQKEGYIVLKEGAQSNLVSDYHQRVLLVEKNGEPLQAIPFEELAVGTPESIDLPFSLTIDSTCRNCQPVSADETGERRGLAAQAVLRNAPLEKENEANLSGATITIGKASGKQNGTYIVMEDIAERPVIRDGKDEYRMSMTRATTSLPFTIKLIDFEKDMHPGTDTARSYSSQVIITDGEAAWPYHIRMNHPLRYKGYTFYQSSFSERPDGEYSILSAVQNKGRAFPYLASAVIFLGLLIHVVLRLQALKGKKA